MAELAQHIETLLIDNDCVIIPDFGGFIAHLSGAEWIEEENLFLPPTRTIGFNRQLKLNDGLLVQSYMKAYETDFSDASKRMEKAVEELITALHKESKIEIHGVGELSLTVHNTYEFHPNEGGVLTPDFYGLDSFEMKTLAGLRIATTKKERAKTLIRMGKPRKNVYEIRINRSLLRNAVAIAASILLFFFLSTPLENTYVPEEGYAQLISSRLFNAAKDETGASTSGPGKQEIEKNLKPKAVKVEEAGKQYQAAKAGDYKKYCIIVASLGNTRDAQNMSDALKSKGFPEACVIEKDKRIRVCLSSYSNQREAYLRLKQIRQDAAYKNAWLLINK